MTRASREEDGQQLAERMAGIRVVFDDQVGPMLDQRGAA